MEKDAVDTCFPVSVDDAKLMINDAQLKRNHSAVQTANTLAQGQSLINKLIEPLENTGGSLLPYYYETRKKIGSTMEELQERHAHVDSQLADRKMKLDVCLVLRTFEEASRDVSGEWLCSWCAVCLLMFIVRVISGLYFVE